MWSHNGQWSNAVSGCGFTARRGYAPATLRALPQQFPGAGSLGHSWLLDLPAAETRPILCGFCHVRIEGRTDAHGNDEAFCLQCGQSDTLENAIREAGEFAACILAEQLGSTFADAFGGRDMFKVTKHHLPERSFRFIVQME